MLGTTTSHIISADGQADNEVVLVSSHIHSLSHLLSSPSLFSIALHSIFNMVLSIRRQCSMFSSPSVYIKSQLLQTSLFLHGWVTTLHHHTQPQTFWQVPGIREEGWIAVYKRYHAKYNLTKQSAIQADQHIAYRLVNSVEDGTPVHLILFPC